MSNITEILSLPAGTDPGTVAPGSLDEDTAFSVGVGIGTLCFIVSTLVVAIRTYTKLAIIKVFGREDWTCLFGWSFFVAFYASCLVGYREKELWHAWHLTLGQTEPIHYTLFIQVEMFGLVFGFIKCSILLQYLRIFQPSSKKGFIWWTCWSLITILALFYIITTFFWIFACSPRPIGWQPWLPGTCISFAQLDIALGYVNVFSDLIIFLIPQREIWALQTKRAYKLKVSFVFAIALFAIACASVRLYYVTVYYGQTDATNPLGTIFTWGFAEIMSGFICACMPSLTKFFSALVRNELTLGSHLGTLLGFGSRRHSGQKNAEVPSSESD